MNTDQSYSRIPHNLGVKFRLAHSHVDYVTICRVDHASQLPRNVAAPPGGVTRQVVETLSYCGESVARDIQLSLAYLSTLFSVSSAMVDRHFNTTTVIEYLSQFYSF